MSPVLSIRGQRPASAVLQLSPARPGVSGSARLPSGEPVPIGRLLSRVLDRYGLPAAREGSSSAGSESAGEAVDLVA